MHFFLQIDANGTIRANDLVGANACVGGNVSARVRNADVLGNITDRMMSSLNRGGDQSAREFLTRSQCRGTGLGEDFYRKPHRSSSHFACLEATLIQSIVTATTAEENG